MDEEAWIDKQWIIWNSSLGIRDFVMIERVQISNNRREAWLEEPYDMVGPFSMDDLERKGEIHFAQCVVMTKERWNKEQQLLRKESYERQRKIREKTFEELDRRNRIRQQGEVSDEKVQRALLELPHGEILKPSQIKAAFRKIAKKAHPDVGGSHEHFVKVSKAKELLLAAC